MMALEGPELYIILIIIIHIYNIYYIILSYPQSEEHIELLIPMKNADSMQVHPL